MSEQQLRDFSEGQAVERSIPLNLATKTRTSTSPAPVEASEDKADRIVPGGQPSKNITKTIPVVRVLEWWELWECKCPPGGKPLPMVPGEHQLRCFECCKPYKGPQSNLSESEQDMN